MSGRTTAKRNQDRQLNMKSKFERLKNKQGIHDYSLEEDKQMEDVEKEVYDDDFVVNDQGRGYIDYGQDTYMDYDDHDEDLPVKKNTIQNAFASMKKTAPQAKPKIDNAEADAHFEALLAGIDYSASKPAQKRKVIGTPLKENKRKHRVSFVPEEPFQDSFDHILDDSTFPDTINDYTQEDIIESVDVPKAVPKAVPIEPLKKLELQTVTMDQMDEASQVKEPEIPESTEKISDIRLDDENKQAMYYLDAYESNGTVFLFGKMVKDNKHVNCCLKISDIHRTIFVLPRQYDDKNDLVTMANVFTEFNEYRKQFNIKEFTAKQVVKQFAFDPDIPSQSDYLKVRYPYSDKQLPSTPKCNTFSHIFGTNTSALEQCLIKRHLKGPCWISFTAQPTASPISWCDVEYQSTFSSITVLEEQPPIPNFTLCSLHINTLSTSSVDTISSISMCIVHHFNIYSKDLTITKVNLLVKPQHITANCIAHQSEKSLLNHFLQLINKYNPDIFIGHGFTNIHAPLLFQRLQTLHLPQFSKCGRLRRKQFPSHLQHLFPGRCLLDSWLTSKELMPSQSSYQLHHLTECPPLHTDRIKDYLVSSELCQQLLQISQSHALSSLQLLQSLNAFPLLFQLTTLSGNLLRRTMCGARAERNEYLLLHTFDSHNYIVPDPFTTKSNTESYKGGLVLDPLVGYYTDGVTIVDFNSLYPSIIMEYNISFETDLESDNSSLGILPTLLHFLVQQRSKVKKEMKKSPSPQLDIQQKALKLTANSMYGCLGFSKSRFYAPHLAELITLKGRELLMKTRDTANQMQLQVIYGDTDSLMLHTNDQKQVNLFLDHVNNQYKYISLGLEGTMSKLLLLKKKKYACLINNEMEIKGLDMKRRDWCVLTRRLCQELLDCLFFSSGDQDEIIGQLYELVKKCNTALMLNEIDRKEFVITKSITKPLHTYQQPPVHVQVAKQLHHCVVGQMIPYVMTMTGGVHSDHLTDSHEIDIEYYKQQQLYPPIKRLLSCIEGIHEEMLGECLGISVKSNVPTTNALVVELESIELKCTCGHSYQSTQLQHMTCPQCFTMANEVVVYHLYLRKMREWIRLYYNHENKQLHGQLMQLKKGMVLNKQTELGMKVYKQFRRCSELLTEKIDAIFEQSEYNEIPLGQLFVKCGLVQ